VTRDRGVDFDIRKGWITKLARGRYYVMDCVAGALDHTELQFAGTKQNRKTAKCKAFKERARLAKARADNEEITAAERRNTLCRSPYITQNSSKWQVTARQKLLEICLLECSEVGSLGSRWNPGTDDC
jgi:hypothetical protein